MLRYAISLPPAAATVNISCDFVYYAMLTPMPPCRRHYAISYAATLRAIHAVTPMPDITLRRLLMLLLLLIAA